MGLDQNNTHNSTSIMKFWQGSDSDSDSSSSEDATEDAVEDNVPQKRTREPSRPLSKDPDEAWRQISPKQVFADIPHSHSSTKDPNCVRLVCISDTHGKHRNVQLPPGDILIHGGDFSKSGETGSMKDLSAYFQESGFAEVICIAGNHDLTLDEAFYEEKWKRFHRRNKFDVQDAKDSIHSCEYLEDSSFTSQRGIEIYGSPWSPFFFDWAFNLYRGQEIMEKWKLIPNLTDVLVTHGPPLGRGDLTSNGVRAGCYDLLVEVQERIVPRVHIFGHIHEGAGVSYDSKTLYINASNLNLCYEAVNYPVVVDLPVDKNQPPKIVRPNCTMIPKDFEEWCNQENFNLVANCIGSDNEKLPHMPSRNDLFTEDAYEGIVNLFHLHRDRETCVELKKALAKLYAQSF